MPTSRQSAATTADHTTRRCELFTLMVFVSERPVKPRVPFGGKAASALTRRKFPTYHSGMMTPDIFTVLANPIRRRILELLRERPYTVNKLVDEFRLHRPTVSEHLQMLRNARLVRDERRGRERYYHIEPSRLVEVQEWLKPFEVYWREWMRSLSDNLDEEEP